METDQTPPDQTAHTRDGEGSFVIKSSDVSGLLGGGQATEDGEYPWPIPPINLATLYRASPEHGRAIHVKAESAFGGGLIGDTARIDEICETGTAELFVLLGLDLETFGNAFLQKIYSPDRRLIGIRRLPAITMKRRKGGFVQTVQQPEGDPKKVKFTADEIVHLREPCPFGDFYSRPAWIGVEGMLELAHAATQWNAAFFKNNAMPEYAVIFKGQAPSKEQKEAVRDFFRNEFGGFEKAHRTLVLHAGEENEIKIEKLTADIKDADFLKLLDASRDRMPIAHGTPPRILGIMSAGQLGGGGEVSSQLFTFEHLTLRPKRRRMLDQLRPLLSELGLQPAPVDALPVEGQVAFRPLDLTPPKDDAEGLPDLVQAGIITPEEARSLLPHLTQASETPADASEKPIERSAHAEDNLKALSALLARV
jgi:capsid portal protein